MVFVDDMHASFSRMVMCHMIADSHVELVEMADRIGIGRRHIQYPGSYREHFDICKSKRRLAVEAGAVELSQRELSRMLVSRKTGERG